MPTDVLKDKSSANSLENTCVVVSFLIKLQVFEYGRLLLKIKYQALSVYDILKIYSLSYNQRFFPIQIQCRLIFSWIELATLLKCCLIIISIIILRHILYLLNLCSCLDQGLFMSHLCDLIFNFSFIMINRIISWIQTRLFFCLLFRICCIIFGWQDVFGRI